jgi:hypothetical protein
MSVQRTEVFYISENIINDFTILNLERHTQRVDGYDGSNSPPIFFKILYIFLTFLQIANKDNPGK